MNIFFDVDDTLVGWNGQLRPHVTDVFQRIRDDGHTIYLWSGYGPRWEVVRRFELHEHITDCFGKPLFDHVERLVQFNIPFIPDYVVDDYKEIVDAFVGTHIRPAGSLLEDNEMWRVYDEFTAFAATRGMDDSLRFQD